ncbi:MAG: spondin domain-containing protein [Paracoccaceae bacterium]|nr:spondin domain-containing protein [Paracoccaceae bacterium]
MRFINRNLLALALAAVGTTFAVSAQATTLKITVTNNQATGGLSITPLYTALHDGNFDAFDLGGTATDGLELIAETGNPSEIAAERRAIDPVSQPLVLGSPAGPPPVQPGESVSGRLSVNATEALYFTFLSMLLPSNDHFIGNDNPLAYQLFDASGNFNGARTISVTGAEIYDAGTEANGFEGAAFIQGAEIGDSPVGEGLIQQGLALSDELFAPGVLLATGDTLNPAFLDFTTDPDNFNLLTIEISQVPVPASAPLLLGALGLLGWGHRRRKQRS